MRKGRTNWGNHTRLPLEKYGELGRDEKSNFCRGYIAPTLFPYLQKRYLMFRECGTLQICYPTNYGPQSRFSYYNLTAPSHGQAFHIITWECQSEGLPLSAATQGRADQLWAWVLVTFTSTEREKDYWKLETSSMSLRRIVFSLDENTRKVVNDQEILSNKDKEYKHR